MEKDEAKAVVLYQEAADLGHITAINNLGVNYENGTGVKKDEAKAVELYAKAARQGNRIAKSNLASK